jgi:hypothetical protein
MPCATAILILVEIRQVGVHVNVDKHHVQFFRNGAALGRLIQLPAHSGKPLSPASTPLPIPRIDLCCVDVALGKGPFTAAVTLVNLHDKVTLSFEHPEDQSEWPYSFDEL